LKKKLSHKVKIKDNDLSFSLELILLGSLNKYIFIL